MFASLAFDYFWVDEYYIPVECAPNHLYLTGEPPVTSLLALLAFGYTRFPHQKKSVMRILVGALIQLYLANSIVIKAGGSPY